VVITKKVVVKAERLVKIYYNTEFQNSASEWF